MFNLTRISKLIKKKANKYVSQYTRIKFIFNQIKLFFSLSCEDQEIVSDIILEKISYQNFASLSHLNLNITYNNYSDNVNIENQLSHTIWRFWYQGKFDQPSIVKACAKSFEVNGYAKKTIFLDKNNIEDYVEIPNYIYDKKKNGKISNVNFSDILRCFLLAEYGGIWVDATIYLSDAIPDFIYQSPFFAFSVTPLELCGRGTLLCSSWFLYSHKNSFLMKALRDMMAEFWKYNETCYHHYYFHLLLRLVIERNKLAASEWHQTPFISNIPPHILQLELFNTFNSDRFEQIKKMSTIHKLTFYGNNFTPQKKNTVYEFLLNQNIG